jgi:hypothetical protein
MDTHGRIDLAEELSALMEGCLRARGDIPESEWCFWEKRNLNIHRVVGLWTGGPSSARTIGKETRATLARHFRRAWWRGLGFGAVVEVRDIEGFPEEFRELVDGRENSKGTWQWVVLVSPEHRKAAGLHTWIEGYLSPVYRALLAFLHEQGFEIESVRREKDGLMKVLTAASA